MLLNVFCIFDTAVKAWMRPIFARNTGEILRQFSDAVTDPNSQLSKHPQDFALFHLGSFDDATANFDMLAAPVRLAMAQDFVSTAPSERVASDNS